MSVKKTFDKPALTIEQQIELLVSRGLYIDDTSLAHKVLSNVNYYHLEGYWECHAIVDDAKSEYIDVGIAELPVGPVHGQGVRPLYRYKLQNESGYEVSTDDALCNQPLDSAQ